MNITFNDNTLGTAMLCYSRIPNILSLTESEYGNKAIIRLTFSDSLSAATSYDAQWTITILGVQFTSVITPSASNGRHFFVGSGAATAAYMARALRTSTPISSQYDIWATNSTVTLQARQGGRKGIGTTAVQTNISTSNLQRTVTDGTTTSTLSGSRILVGVSIDGEYQTTMEKMAYGGECSFDVTPVIGTFGEDGGVHQFSLAINQLTADGTYNALGSTQSYITNGYSAVNSANYLYPSAALPLVNRNCGQFVYQTPIPLSILKGVNVGSWEVKWVTLTTAGQQIASATTTYTNQTAAPLIVDMEIDVPMTVDTAYVDVTVGSNQTIRYEVIKPLKMTEGETRIYWRNELGGVAFFDFTSSERNEYTTTQIRYDKNDFDYYTADGYEGERLLDNQVAKETTLTSHLIKGKKNTKLFESMAKTKRMWMYDDDGSLQYLLPRSIQISESNDYNDIFQCTLTFTRSNNV